jgi:hypothetical protein
MFRAALGVVRRTKRARGAVGSGSAEEETPIGSKNVHPSTLRWLIIRRFLEVK